VAAAGGGGGIDGGGRVATAVAWSKTGTGSAQVRSDGPKEGTGRGGETAVGSAGAGLPLDLLDLLGAEVKVGARDPFPGSVGAVPAPCTYRATSRS
jgi:hypothetical protein